VFEIDDPDVLGVLGIQQTEKRRFSFLELFPKREEVERQASLADGVKPEQRSRFQTAVTHLHQRLTLYQKLANTLEISGSERSLRRLQDFETRIAPVLKSHVERAQKGDRFLTPILQEVEPYRFIDQVAEFYPLPLPQEGSPEWASMGRGVIARIHTTEFHPGVTAYAAMGDAWRTENAALFHQMATGYRDWLVSFVPGAAHRATYEFFFNFFAPFYRSLVIYLGVFLMVLVSWMGRSKAWNQAAFYALILAWSVHTFGLVSRMVLQNRPPVTNLYSSAIFVGWVAVLLGMGMERLHKNGVSSLAASILGFLTLIIAHHLSTSGDTLEMMRAVLDSNFWLATHVVTITIGYGSTFLSGFLATVYILRQRVDKNWTPALADTLERMVYGVVCFSTLLSFVGTVLGGIWADQSWGRFWGWDPKENGALLIVLWNVFILHARWGGYAKGLRLMRLAVVGNGVTAFSWFGVNMLGIGLHSYGFMDKAFVWLMAFIAFQAAILLVSKARRPSRLKTP
jgi:ABC-type transport system involved in cytochrome c biogenesis permease subunit